MRQIAKWSARMAVVGTAFGFILGASAARVEATNRRYTASVCQPQWADLAFSHHTTDTDFGIVNLATSVMNLTCPLMNNTSIPNTSASKLTLVEVHGVDSNDDVGSAGAIIAKVCGRSATGTGLTCGNPRSSHDADIDTNGDRKGWVKMVLQSSYLTALGLSTRPIIYLWIDVPASDTPGSSVIRTVYVSN